MTPGVKDGQGRKQRPSKSVTDGILCLMLMIGDGLKVDNFLSEEAKVKWKKLHEQKIVDQADSPKKSYLSIFFFSSWKFCSISHSIHFWQYDHQCTVADVTFDRFALIEDYFVTNLVTEGAFALLTFNSHFDLRHLDSPERPIHLVSCSRSVYFSFTF